MLLKDFLGPLLSEYQPKILPAPGLKRAAVLVPICEFSTDKQPVVVFTKRSESVGHHKGEMSFPGGVQKDGETLQETALRETREELGASPFEILGRVDDFITITDYIVAPFVGYVKDCPSWVPNKEVAKVIQVPLRELLKEEQWEMQRYYRGQEEIPVHFFYWPNSRTSDSEEKETIWGATAHILRNFLTLLRNSPDALVYLHSS
ncbi:MAG: NUDIX hydrolase [Candidatus Thorarchaeota archaeon]